MLQSTELHQSTPPLSPLPPHLMPPNNASPCATPLTLLLTLTYRTVYEKRGEKNTLLKTALYWLRAEQEEQRKKEKESRMKRETEDEGGDEALRNLNPNLVASELLLSKILDCQSD